MSFSAFGGRRGRRQRRQRHRCSGASSPPGAADGSRLRRGDPAPLAMALAHVDRGSTDRHVTSNGRI